MKRQVQNDPPNDPIQPPGAAIIQVDTLATPTQDWLDRRHERVEAQEISADSAAGDDRGARIQELLDLNTNNVLDSS